MNLIIRKLLLSIFVLLLINIPFHKAYGATPIKILIVPGHDNETWGSEYGNIKEADMTLRLATLIYNNLKKDKRFDVYITRDPLGYTKEFKEYFDNRREEIISFKEKAKKQTQDKINTGGFVKVEGVPHNNVNTETSIILYGINKWANENSIDAVIHIHFNDYPRKTKWVKGKYKGFAVYTPESQMKNAEESMVLAKNIFKQLKRKYTTSTYEKESSGLVESQSLIAIGSNGSLEKGIRSVLIEYGYIYRFGKTSFRHKAYKDMSALTTTAIKNTFFKK
jgi:N-acetylmuramoyl-L-alanine amidase